MLTFLLPKGCLIRTAQVGFACFRETGGYLLLVEKLQYTGLSRAGVVVDGLCVCRRLVKNRAVLSTTGTFSGVA